MNNEAPSAPELTLARVEKDRETAKKQREEQSRKLAKATLLNRIADHKKAMTDELDDIKKRKKELKAALAEIEEIADDEDASVEDLEIVLSVAQKATGSFCAGANHHTYINKVPTPEMVFRGLPRGGLL